MTEAKTLHESSTL